VITAASESVVTVVTEDARDAGISAIASVFYRGIDLIRNVFLSTYIADAWLTKQLGLVNSTRSYS
jgi:hypothetical protein